MKFSTREDTDQPAEKLFEALSDFSTLERLLLRRGAMVRRIDGKDAWQIGFDWRGKARHLNVTLNENVPPERLAFTGQSDQFDLYLQLTVVPLTPSKSRLIFELDVTPRGMKARLLLQTAKLTKHQLDRKFSQRVAEFVLNVSARQYG